MTQIYGSLWRERFGPATDGGGGLTETAEVWRIALHEHRITREEITVGLKTCLARRIAFAPSLPEFIALCKTERPAAAYHQTFRKALPKPIDREGAARSISAIREILGAGRATTSTTPATPPEGCAAGRENTATTGDGS